MAQYRLKIAMSQNGRGSRDVHSVVFRIKPNGTFNRPEAKQLALDLSGALAAVMFNKTNFLRATFVQLDAYGKAVPYTQFSVPLATVGDNTFTTGDGSANEQICLSIEKGADLGKAGRTLVRHAISAVEYAAFLNAGTLPARFTAAPTGSYGVGQDLGANIKQAFADNAFTIQLPPVTIGSTVTERTVETIAAQDFVPISATKRRRSAASEIAEGVAREMRAAARQAWRLYNKFIATGIPADVATTILGLITTAWAAYNALVAAEKALITPPLFPALV